MIQKTIKSAAVVFILMVFICALALAGENKTAYTRDGVHFVSKERVEENIRYEYAKADDYREVQVPLGTIVVGASVIPEWAEEEEEQEAIGDEREEEMDAPDKEENAPNYPYATIGVGLLLICGLTAAVAWMRSHKSRRGRRSLRRR